MVTLNKQELKKIYQILKAYDENLIINPAKSWERDYYDESIADKKGLKQILKKIKLLLPRGEAEECKKAVLRRRYDSFNNEIDEAVYRKIENAFENKKRLEIGYFDMDSADVIQRQIDIYYKSRKYIIAYCHLKSAIRKFRTSRMVSAKPIDKKYNIPENFDKHKYL